MQLRLQQQPVPLILPFILVCVTEPVFAHPTVADAQKAQASIDMSAITLGIHPRSTLRREAANAALNKTGSPACAIAAERIAPSATAPEANSRVAQVVPEHVPVPSVPSHDADLYRNRAITAFRDGDFRRAISELDQALRLDPNDVRARNIRGNALDEIGAFELALADYDDAIRIDPNNPAVLHDRAILWRRKGALDKALLDLDRAIRFSFNNAHIYCDRGLVWYEKGRRDRAIADFKRAVEIDPNFVKAYLSRGLIMHHSSE